MHYIFIKRSSPQKKSIDEHLNRDVILMKSVDTSCKSCFFNNDYAVSKCTSFTPICVWYHFTCILAMLHIILSHPSPLSPANPDISVNSHANSGEDESEGVKHHLASNGVDTMTALPSLSVSSSEQDVSVSQSPQPLLFNTEPSQ